MFGGFNIWTHIIHTVRYVYIWNMGMYVQKCKLVFYFIF